MRTVLVFVAGLIATSIAAAPGDAEGGSGSDDLAAIVKCSQRLAAGLYTKMSESLPRDENLIVSPATATTQLALIANSETGDTEQEIRKTLGLDLKRSRMEAALAQLAAHRKNDFNRVEQAYLGLQLEQAGKGDLRVKSVLPGSAAAQAGFQPGERLLSIRTMDTPGEGVAISSAIDFVHALDEAAEVVRVRCRPANSEETVTRRLSLTARPKPAPGNPKRDPVQIRFSSAMWYSASDPPLQSVRDFARESLEMQLTTLNLDKDRKRIEEWFSRKSVPDREVSLEEAIGKESRLALSDSVWMRPIWSPAVKVGEAVEMPFSLGKRRGRVPAVPLTGRFLVAQDESMVGVELPCLGGLAVSCFAPLKPENWPALEKRLAQPDWPKLLANGTLKDVTVVVPEFDLIRLNDLRAPISELGMTTGFTPAAKKESDKEAKTAGIVALQQVQLTVAAKASEGEAEPKNGIARIELDRAFVFVIHDRQTKEILVVGRMANPRAR